MTTSIPIEEAKLLGAKYNLSQVLIFASDSTHTVFVTTWGKDDAHSAAAAAGGNEMKRNWGWPENTIVESARVQALHEQIAALQSHVRHLEDQWRNHQPWKTE